MRPTPFAARWVEESGGGAKPYTSKVATQEQRLAQTIENMTEKAYLTTPHLLLFLHFLITPSTCNDPSPPSQKTNLNPYLMCTISSNPTPFTGKNSGPTHPANWLVKTPAFDPSGPPCLYPLCTTAHHTITSTCPKHNVQRRLTRPLKQMPERISTVITFWAYTGNMSWVTKINDLQVTDTLELL